MHWGNKVKTPVDDFVTQLTSTSPVLSEIHRQHILEQGELLPHVLMGEIARVVVANVGGAPAEWLDTLMRQLEAGLVSGKDAVAELVAVSFVENLTGENTAIQALIPQMGVALREEVKSICGV